jgi:hypothetical protein
MSAGKLLKVGGWMLVAATVLLFAGVCLYYVELVHPLDGFSGVFLTMGVFFASMSTGALGAVLFAMGWVVNELAKKGQ